MERGAATRGKVARVMAGAEAIEIKATIPNRQIRQELARFGLTADNDEERFIYFFDVPKFDRLGAEIIARARRVENDFDLKFDVLGGVLWGSCGKPVDQFGTGHWNLLRGRRWGAPDFQRAPS